MKRFGSLAVMALVGAAFGFKTWPVVGQSAVVLSPIRIEVKVDNKVSNQGAFGEASDTTLHITVMNPTLQDYKRVEVKYYVFGHHEGGAGFSVVETGQKMVALHKGAQVVVDSKPVRYAARTEHPRPTRFGGVREASGLGKTYGGYGVQILDGKTVLAEAFSSPTLKNEIGKGSNFNSRKPAGR